MQLLTVSAWDGSAAQLVTRGDPVTAPEPLDLHAEDARRQFEGFYRSSFDAVYRALALSFGDADLAQEATSEAMARCFQHWGKVSSYDNPAGWVYRVGLNWGRSRVSRRLRDASRSHRLPRPGDVPGADALVPDPQLNAALASLDLRYRAVVVLRYLLDWSEAETASALRLPEGTVKSRLSRGLDQLRLRLEQS